MALSKNFDEKSEPKKKLHQRKGFYILLGFLVGIVVIASLYQTSVYFSTNESCMICHVHPHATDSWKLSTHVNNGSGVMTNCVDCHLPPKENTWKHYTAKAALGLRDVWGT
jgi:nitrate/TMAO reductase-like tetraheme cytochrome c subunit